VIDLKAIPRPLGEFYATSGAIFRVAATSRFRTAEFVEMLWFVIRVSLLPAILLALPIQGIVTFQLNQLLAEVGAKDVASAGAGVAAVRELGPLTSVLVVSGAGATAVCADLAARVIREEIDAMHVLGVDPIQRLVVPRVAALMVVSVLLTGVVTLSGLVCSFVLTVYVQGVSPGLFVSNLTLITAISDFYTSLAKSLVFGLVAALISCHLGLRVRGGPKNVGNAVNETVVYTFVLLFFINVVISAIYKQFAGGAT
jgi:phospholipid/cholesterol/gamma-HCH transport system permease protein